MATYAKTAIEAASALKISDRQLHNWRRESWFPADGFDAARGWNVASIAAAREKHGRKKGSSASAQLSEIRAAREAVRLKREQAEYELFQTELAARQGELISRAVVVQYQRELVGVVRDRLAGFPQMMARLVTGRTLKNRVRSEATSLVRELLDWMASESDVIGNERKRSVWEEWKQRTIKGRRKK